MLRQELSEKVYSFLQKVKYISGGIVLFVSALLKANVPYIPFISSFFDLCQHNAWWIIILFTCAGGLSQFLNNRIGSPDIWRVVQHILDQYREEVFSKDENTKEDAEHFHRITLFKHFKWRWALVRSPWSGWVVPVARSGSRTKTKIQCFLASKEHPDDAEGVAGQTWARNRTVIVSDLPDLNIDNPQETDIIEYAKRAFVTKEWICNRMQTNRRGLQCRSLFGICIEVKGIPWGVLVIDSRNPEPSRLRKSYKNAKLEAYKDILSKLLERV
ncbi:hypothetical protein [uncultured Candidatus Kuenenia sp.]|uniref:hypothetical protein n=1 Tax=uncultured Candidatus Kuenenia sp. TaxID=1048336 RepID=UPI0002F353BA|nr:hypothetical protein [uncultured Candidatus Kuenenia sp.]MCF6153246.1 hypothetical protein [Candidatus Kuenenia stuttgartiensis]